MILPDVTPTSSQDSADYDCEDEFDLYQCNEINGVTPSQIVDFLWKYAPGEQERFSSLVQAEYYYLRCEPRDLLQILKSTLSEAVL